MDIGRPLLIFPQGTRVKVEDKVPFKKGVGRIYQALNISCVPIALNSGKVWPKKGPKNSKKHAAPLSNNSKIGVLHGAAQMVCQDKFGQISETESISAGLDYPGVSPLHCFLKETGRANYVSQTDEDALNAYKLIRKLENIKSKN